MTRKQLEKLKPGDEVTICGSREHYKVVEAQYPTAVITDGKYKYCVFASNMKGKVTT